MKSGESFSSAATEMAPEHKLKRIMGEMEQLIGQMPEEAQENFLETGEAPDGMEELAQAILAKTDEFASEAQKLDEDAALKELSVLYQAFGGRYDDLKVGEITLDEADKFTDLIRYNGSVKTPNDENYWQWPAKEVSLEHAMRADEFSVREIADYYARAKETALPEDAEEARQVRRQLLAEVYFDKVKQQLNDGESDGLTENQAKLFCQTMTAERIEDAPEIAVAMANVFREKVTEYGGGTRRVMSRKSLLQWDDEPKWEDEPYRFNTYMDGYLCSDAMATAVETADRHDAYIAPEAGRLQKFGDKMLESLSVSYDDSGAEYLHGLVKCGYEPATADGLSAAAKSVMAQTLLAEQGFLTPEKSDQLVLLAVQEARKTGTFPPLMQDLKTSGENATVNLWSDETGKLLQGFFDEQSWMSEQPEQLIDDNGMPSEELLHKIAEDAVYSSSRENRYVAHHPELFTKWNAQMYEDLFPMEDIVDHKELTPRQEATLQEYWKVVDQAPDLTARFKKLVFAREQYEDGFEGDPYRERLSVEQIGDILEVLKGIGKSEAAHKTSLEDSAARWILESEMDERGKTAAEFGEKIEQWQMPELLSAYPDFAKTLFQQNFRKLEGDEDLSAIESASLLTYLDLLNGNEEDVRAAERLKTGLCQQRQNPETGKTEYRYQSLSQEDLRSFTEVIQILSGNMDDDLGTQHVHDAASDWLLWQDANEARKLVEGFAGKVDDERLAELVKEHSGFAERLFARQFGAEILDRDHMSETEQAMVRAMFNLEHGETSSAKSVQMKQFLMAEVADDEAMAFLPRYAQFQPRAIEQCQEVITTLYDSNSTQLAHLANQLAEQVLTDNPERAVEQVKKLEHIFLRKNVPDFAKLYCCANVLYEGSIAGEQNISPVLKNAEDTREILMTDLLKNAIRSGNRSLRAYLEHGTADWGEVDDDDGMLAEYRSAKKFRTRFLGYARNLGLETMGEIREQMDAYHDERETKRRSSVVQGEDGKWHMRDEIREGDLVKGINVDYLHTMLQDGYNCPEMVGDGAKRDMTHWDTDFGRVVADAKTLDEAVSKSLANGYGSGVHIIVRRDERFVETKTGDEDVYTDFRQYEAFSGGDTLDADFRGVRTGLGSEDVDMYVVSQDGRKHLARLKYELAKNDTYVPIVDRASEEVLFTPEEFTKMRERMGGMRHYGYELADGKTDLDEFKFAEDLQLPGERFAELVENFDENERQTLTLNIGAIQKIYASLMSSTLPDEVKALFRASRVGFSEDASSGSVDILNTGSTGRFTNKPGDADFDYVWRIDRAVLAQYQNQILQALTEDAADGTPAAITRFGQAPDGRIGGITARGLRMGIVEVNGTEVEVDISPVAKTDKMEFSSEAALEQRLNAIREQDPERYKQVIANIIVAKEKLKAAQVYKNRRSDATQGGLGGIGVENWILQSGGSLRQAAQEFLAAAQDGERSFTDFTQHYAIFDLGENHFSSGYPFDEFVSGNMSEDGYRKMVGVCQEIVAEV